MNNQTQAGGCLCGAVSYSIAGPLREVIACHCTQCRKTSGHFVAAAATPANDLTITSHIFVKDAGDYYDIPAGAETFEQDDNRDG